MPDATPKLTKRETLEQAIGTFEKAHERYRPTERFVASSQRRRELRDLRARVGPAASVSVRGRVLVLARRAV